MKNLLIATTALVATAGVAAADISVSGDGRMGLVYDDRDTFGLPGDSNIKMSSRIRIGFSASGETDNGLSFGGFIRADNSGAGSAGRAGSVFISGSFGKLSMGDVDGAAKAAVGQVSGIGYTNLSDINEITYLNSGTDVNGDGSNDTLYPTPSALYEYAAGSTVFYVGIGQIGTQIGTVSVPGQLLPAVGEVGQSYSVGAKWSNDNGLTIAGGYEATNDVAGTGDASDWVLGAQWTNGTWGVKGIYLQGEWAGFGDVQQYAVSGDWTSGATTVTAFYTKKDLQDFDTTSESYGLGAAYDLGGGATLAGGIASVSPINDADTYTVGDLGIKFNF
ncbi:porin [Falsihalocynthiibacter sp. S25ZX9]|uniref:porin n=1 Tax=Falsihalocynthiibacter sp. S25ZX9 TaxID=3240870 RepID=UPI0035109016